MERKIQVYVEGRRLELFTDEKIQVNSSIQNIADISKVYTDFSQSFTIPCTDTNNQIFQHFYETDVNSTVDHNIRRKGHIEIDLTFFRRGKISIEKANVKKGNAENYQVSFYGDILSLKDKFSEDLLSNLDYTTINHTYNGTEVENRVKDGSTNYNVRYPLISSKRIWQHNGNNPNATFPTYLPAGIIAQLQAADINTSNGNINYSELFPAVKISKIFDLIQLKYGVTFTGLFLLDKRFTNMYLWFKNKDELRLYSSIQPIDLSTLTTYAYSVYDLSPYFDLVNNTLNVTYLQDVVFHYITISVISMTGTGYYYIDVYRNGILYTTLTANSATALAPIYIQNASGLNDTFTFFVKSDPGVTAVTAKIQYSVTVMYFDPVLLTTMMVVDKVVANCLSNTLVSQIDLQSLAPKQKIADFFSGILKEFNLTCYSTDVDTFQIEPLSDWYSKGAVIDITEFTDVDSIDIERVKLYKKITFEYEKSNSFMNKAYFQNFAKEYGNTSQQYIYDGGEYTIKVPFENLLFNRFTATDLQVAYSLDSSFAPYVPNPCLIYQYEQKTASYYFNNGSAIVHETDYVPFGQDVYYQNNQYSSNFSPETSTLLNIPIQQSLFATYYFPYLTNLFNLKNRLTSVKTNLPVSLTTGLKLNDRLVIRGKRYLINEMKLDLTTGQTDFTLLNDFSPVRPTIVLPARTSGDSIQVPISLPNNVHSMTITSLTADTSVDIPYTEEDVVVTITVAPNVNTTNPIQLDYTLINGGIQTEIIYITQ